MNLFIWYNIQYLKLLDSSRLKQIEIRTQLGYIALGQNFKRNKKDGRSGNNFFFHNCKITLENYYQCVLAQAVLKYATISTLPLTTTSCVYTQIITIFRTLASKKGIEKLVNLSIAWFALSLVRCRRRMQQVYIIQSIRSFLAKNASIF